ncbi:MAG: ABC transporter substrate-binding protein [Trueperaceae bacterium]|nr:ABC transporter substrate-binding protein [Trueperaceae bacterium]
MSTPYARATQAAPPHPSHARLVVRFLAAAMAAVALSFGGLAVAQEGALRVALEPPVRLDPAFASSDAEIAVVNAVYDYLVDVDVDNLVQPRLAAAWQIDESGLRYTFELREGVTFHDGRPLTAEDVVWTFDRLRDADLGVPTADLYANVAAIEATAPLEVTFTLHEVNPFFLYDLSDNHALVLPAGSDAADTVFVGTGPFVVESYAVGDRMRLRANPDYFEAGKPGVAAVEFLFFSDQVAGVDALRGGQVDLVMRMPTPLFLTLQGQPGIDTVAVPTNGFDLVRLRADRAPGDDPRVQQALKLATDPTGIIEVVTFGYGAATNHGPIGPLYGRYHLETLRPPARDVERARALLAEAGYPDGLDLVLHTPDSGDRPALASVLQDQWAAAGIRLRIEVEPESVYYGEDGWLEVDLGITGWGSRPVPSFYLDVMVACGAVWNEAHFCDPEVDELIAFAKTTLDDDARTDAYHRIQEILLDRGPFVIPYFFPQFGAISDRFDGFAMKAFPGRTDLAAITLR